MEIIHEINAMGEILDGEIDLSSQHSAVKNFHSQENLNLSSQSLKLSQKSEFADKNYFSPYKMTDYIEHNFKIPVLAQIRAVELLLSGAFGEVSIPQREVLEETLASCKILSEMLDTTAMSLKLEDNTVRCFKETFNIISVIEESLGKLKSGFDAKNIRFSIRSAKKNLSIFADKKQISKLFDILLNFCMACALEKSGMVLGVKLAQNREFFLVSIIFKSTDFTASTFEKLLDFSSTAVRFNKIGVGMNLYLAKQIVLNHNGEISVNSDSRGVCSFNIKFPNINVCKNHAN